MSDRKTKGRGWGPQDYWHIGPIYAQKQFALLGIIALSVAVLMVLGLPLRRHGVEEESIPAYRYDDPALAELTGLVQVLDDADRVRYVGEVAAGAYTGQGKVFDKLGGLLYDGPLADGVYEGPGAKVYQAGELVYAGGMAGNLYEGQGRRINPDTGIVSEGQFSRGFLEGQGQEFYADGTLLREGAFSRDLLEGEGCEYSREGVLLREGTFSAGLLHGEGREYTGSGAPRYEGQFWRGIYHGQGTLYDSLLEVRKVSGTFVYGKLTGQGAIYHPSGQLLYTGQVYDDQPRADAFLGLSLAEVETAFTSHWLLYSCDGITAFVYPYFSLMFITESPVDLISPTQQEEASQRERQELSDAMEQAVPEPAAPTEPEPAPPPPVYEDELLSPGTDKRSVIITRVLSYGQPLPYLAQPNPDFVSGRHRPGWREWFSNFALNELVQGASVRRSGQFIYRFTPWPQADGGLVDEFGAEHAGIETMMARKEDKDMSLWYQTAQWGDSP